MSWQKGRSYSQDLCDRMLAVKGSVAQYGCAVGVSGSYVSRVRTRRNAQDVCTVHPRGGCVLMHLAGLHEQLLVQVAAATEQTLTQLCQRAAEGGVQVSTVPMHKSLKRWGLPFKKRLFSLPSSTAPT